MRRGVYKTDPWYSEEDGKVYRTTRCRYCKRVARHEATDLTDEEREAVVALAVK